MEYVAQVLSGAVPEPIENRDGAKFTTIDELLKEVRVCNRHGCIYGVFVPQAPDNSPASGTTGKDGGSAPPHPPLIY